MAEEAKLKELQKHQRLSFQHLRRGALILAITAVALLIAQHFITMRLWIPFIILAVLSFTVIGDTINYFYCGRQIRKLQQE